MRKIVSVACLLAAFASTPAFAMCEPNPHMMSAMGHAMAGGNAGMVYSIQQMIQAEQQRCMWQYEMQLRQQQLEATRSRAQQR
jgi:hypothetical protein